MDLKILKPDLLGMDRNKLSALFIEPSTIKPPEKYESADSPHLYSFLHCESSNSPHSAVTQQAVHELVLAQRECGGKL